MNELLVIMVRLKKERGGKAKSGKGYWWDDRKDREGGMAKEEEKGNLDSRKDDVKERNGWMLEGALEWLDEGG